MKTLIALAALAAPLPAVAQDHMHHDMPMPAPSPAPTPEAQDHSQHDMPGMNPEMGLPLPRHFAGCRSFGAQLEDGSVIDGILCQPGQGSGTSRLPAYDGGMSGAHLMTGDWMLMAHGYLWGVYTDQGGPRGDDMAFVGSMAMLSASRPLGEGARLELRSMMSLEPLMGERGYPNLFATGETANGEPLVDRQHPHDLFMELAARIDVDVGADARLFLYGGPVGEPALGPSAFMHRRSARYLPLAPITHHWFDSTHITYGVVTAGLNTRTFQIEGSAFRGREPDEDRWDIETPKLDSWSVRATWNPDSSWAVQASHGQLKAPETAHPGIDEARTTASVQYAGASSGVSAMLAFSAKNRMPGPTLTAWLAETNWNIDDHHSIFGRVENVANDELFPDHSDPLHDQLFRVTKFEGGYAYRIPLDDDWQVALGGTVAAYAKPDALDAAYGEAPVSATAFVKLSLGN